MPRGESQEGEVEGPVEVDGQPSSAGQLPDADPRCSASQRGSALSVGSGGRSRSVPASLTAHTSEE